MLPPPAAVTFNPVVAVLDVPKLKIGSAPQSAIIFAVLNSSSLLDGITIVADTKYDPSGKDTN